MTGNREPQGKTAEMTLERWASATSQDGATILAMMVCAPQEHSMSPPLSQGLPRQDATSGLSLSGKPRRELPGVLYPCLPASHSNQDQLVTNPSEELKAALVNSSLTSLLVLLGNHLPAARMGLQTSLSRLRDKQFVCSMQL